MFSLIERFIKVFFSEHHVTLAKQGVATRSKKVNSVTVFTVLIYTDIYTPMTLTIDIQKNMHNYINFIYTLMNLIMYAYAPINTTIYTQKTCIIF